MNLFFKYITIFILMLLFCFAESREQFRMSDLSEQVDLQWSFVSQIHHTWLQNIITTYFKNCSTHQQLKVLYNCNTTTQKYFNFWKQLLHGIQQIKFKQAYQEDNHQWSDMMTLAAKQWITVNKTSLLIQIEQAYEDIKQFPNNLIEFAQFYPQYQQQFQHMQKASKWQRVKKSYLSKKDKDNQQMQKDQMKILKKYFDRTCFNSENYMSQCKMPLQRYSYYLKDMFFYFFQQPQKYSHYDQNTQTVSIDQLLDFKITKLWRDMRSVMREHLNLDQQISLEEVQKVSVQILQSVMESLIRKNIQKTKGKQIFQQNQNSQL